MRLIDWILVLGPLIFVLCFAVYTRRMVKSVADFLAGGRCAGRYLICNARGEAASGVANTTSKFEVIMISGFTLAFWDRLSVPILMLVGITGFVIYRYRETRAMTLAQFFEMRYSRRFRIFMGALAFGSGIINYGIFPAISSRFFVYFIGLPESVHLLGMSIQTYVLVMAFYLSCSLAMLLAGGQITLMVTDCVEGILSHLIYMIVIVAVFYTVGWTQIVRVMSDATPRNSMLNPFDAWDLPDFNFWFIALSLILNVYGTMALQNSHGFNSAALTPHESRMAGVLGNWRTYARTVMLLVVTTAAVTFLRHPDFAVASAPVHDAIGQISDPQIRKQMTIPVALRYLLPTGVKGLFWSMMVLGLLAGDCGHMHSWGSIFVQDVVLPLRKKPLTPRQHLLLLRLAVTGVAMFAMAFSVLFTQTQYIALWFQVTSGIFISGAGAAIIGGLYWKRGTTGAAWTAVIAGAVLSLVGIGLQQWWPEICQRYGSTAAQIGLTLPKKFPFNGVVVAFIAAVASSALYVGISLITRRTRFDLDAMLNRKKHVPVIEVPPGPRSISRWLASRVLMFDDEFSLADKWVSIGILGWSLLLVAVNLVVSAWNLFVASWTTEAWARYWFVTGIAVPFVIGAVTLVWFGIGGIVDIKAFFAALKAERPDETDDGRVTEAKAVKEVQAPVVSTPGVAVPVVVR